MASRPKRDPKPKQSRSTRKDKSRGATEPDGRRARPHKDPATGRLVFPELSPRAYEHPADRAALSAMRAIPGFDSMVRFVFRQVGDRALRLASLASAVRVTPRQFPAVHALHVEAARTLDLDPIPELYIDQTPLVNAGALGVDRPFVVLKSGSLGLLEPDELQFLLGHELGHVLSGHALYKTMLRLLLRMYWMASAVPLGSAALLAITAAMLEWDRKSELSADRAGLLVAQSPEVAMRVHMKLAGGGRTAEMSVDEFLAQAHEYEAGGTAIDSLMKLLQLTGTTHPFPVLRLAELKKWVDGGGYQDLLEGDYPVRSLDHEVSVYEDLIRSSKTYRDDFVKSKDPLARWLRDFGRKAQGAGESVIDFLRRRATRTRPRARRRKRT